MTQTGSSFQRPSLYFWLYCAVGLAGISISLNVVQAVLLHDPSFIFRLLHPVRAQADDHFRGALAPVTVIEYGDFQCPFCAKMHPELRHLAETGQIRWIYRNYPLEGHPLAEPAAETAECAGQQGKFWDFSDSVFIQQKSIKSLSDIQSIAVNAGVNERELASCLSSGWAHDRVQKEMALGNTDLVLSTPTLFINGKQQVGAVGEGQLEQLVRAAN